MTKDMTTITKDAKDVSPTITVDAGRAIPGCALYAYAIDEMSFDDVALSTYFASGKFDRASMHRWPAGKLVTNPHKAQIFRASVDNTIVLFPVDGLDDGHRRPMTGSVLIAGYTSGPGPDPKFMPVCVGVITAEPFALHRTYADAVVPVHVITTLCGANETIAWTADRRTNGFPMRRHPDLPGNVHLLCEDVQDAASTDGGGNGGCGGDDDGGGNGCGGGGGNDDDGDDDSEYGRQKRMARWSCEILETSMSLRTPSPTLESQRISRVNALLSWIRGVGTEDLEFPPTRRSGVSRPRTQTLDAVMRTHDTYAELFGRIMGRK